MCVCVCACVCVGAGVSIGGARGLAPRPAGVTRLRVERAVADGNITYRSTEEHIVGHPPRPAKKLRVVTAAATVLPVSVSAGGPEPDPSGDTIGRGPKTVGREGAAGAEATQKCRTRVSHVVSPIRLILTGLNSPPPPGNPDVSARACEGVWTRNE